MGGSDRQPLEAPKGTDALLTDLYQLTMLEAYLKHGKTGPAVFEFFARKLPPNRGFLIAAGLEQALDYLEGLRFTNADLDWLKASGLFGDDLLDYLADFRFSGEVHAVPEGTAVFANEPILRVKAPLPEGQFIESRLINILHFQTLIASKAARHVLIAPDKQLVDFGMRRAHGAEAGLFAARASYIVGYAGTATVLAGARYGIPVYGTMAHSFIEAFDAEVDAFEAFARARPKNLTLLIDTYDTETAARKVVALARRLQRDNIEVKAVRLDSGDLITLSKSVRAILDEGGQHAIGIFASGGIDEKDLLAFKAEGAPIVGYGVGTNLTTSADCPALDCAYKLQEFDGLPRRKHSPGKATWPGRKQVWRRYDAEGRMSGDTLSVESDTPEGEPLLELVMSDGRRLKPSPPLAEVRARAAETLARLPEPLRRLEESASYPVTVAPVLRRLAEETDRRIAEQEAKSP